MSDSTDMKIEHQKSDGVSHGVVAATGALCGLFGAALAAMIVVTGKMDNQPLISIDVNSANRDLARKQIVSGDLPRELFGMACTAAVSRLYNQPNIAKDSLVVREELKLQFRFVPSGDGPSGTK